VVLYDLHTGTSEEHVSIACDYQIFSVPIIEFRIRSVSKFLFRIQNTAESLDETGIWKRGKLFVDLGPGGADIIIESLPVEIVIPSDIIFGDPVILEGGAEADYSEGDFVGLTPTEVTEAKDKFKRDPHGQFTILRNDLSDEGGATSVFTHLRLHITPDLEIKLSTAAPISFGRCGFLNLPVIALHDFQIIPSPRLSYMDDRKLLDTSNWVRHTLWVPNDGMGAFAMRSIEFDTESGYFKKKFPNAEKRDVKAEWVFEDLIFPIASGPIAIHFTLGVRRNFDNFNVVTDVLSFSNAAYAFSVKSLIVRIYTLYLQTMPLENGALKAQAHLGFSLGKDAEVTEETNPWEISVEIGEENTIRVGLVRLADKTGKYSLKLSKKLIIHPIRALAGYSINKLIRQEDFWDSVEILFSLWVHDKDARWNPDGSGTTPPAPDDGIAWNDFEPDPVSPFAVDGPKGKPFSLLITNLGWKQGKPAFDTFSLPEGYSPKIGPVKIDLFEFGLLNEDDATYFTTSGGVQFGEAKKYEGGIWFKRMRFRVGGNKSTDFFKLDGFTGRLAVQGKMELEIGGYYTDETNTPLNYRKEEFGFTGKFAIDLACVKMMFASDLIAGRLTQLNPNSHFWYL